MTLLQLIGGFGPLIAAAITAWIAGDFRPWAAQLVRWQIPARWWAYAVLVPIGIVVLVNAVNVVFGGGLDPARIPQIGPIVMLFVLTFLQGGLEEPGWRGMALSLFQKRFNATIASVVLGVLWSMASPIVRHANTRGSVLPTMLFHTV